MEARQAALAPEPEAAEEASIYYNRTVIQQPMCIHLLIFIAICEPPRSVGTRSRLAPGALSSLYQPQTPACLPVISQATRQATAKSSLTAGRSSASCLTCATAGLNRESTPDMILEVVENSGSLTIQTWRTTHRQAHRRRSQRAESRDWSGGGGPEVWMVTHYTRTVGYTV